MTLYIYITDDENIKYEVNFYFKKIKPPFRSNGEQAHFQ